MIPRRAWQLVTLTLLVGVFAYAPTARAQTEVSTHHVSCKSIVAGSIKFSPPLTGAGTDPETVKISGKLSGCVDSDDATVKIVDGKSKFKGKLTGVPNSCGAVLTGVGLTGTITIKWKTVDPITPKETEVTVNDKSVTTDDYMAFGSDYITTHIGTPNIAVATTGAFSGTDGGAASYSDSVSTEDVGSILNACAGPKGLKKTTIGIGVLSNG